MNQDFLDLLRAFAAADVRFLVVGACALGLHGRPRATGDLDVWIDATPDNARRVMRALDAFGAPTADITEADWPTSRGWSSTRRITAGSQSGSALGSSLNRRTSPSKSSTYRCIRAASR